MNDVQVLTFGCMVTIIGIAGAYVYLRERWLASQPAAQARKRQAPAAWPDRTSSRLA